MIGDPSHFASITVKPLGDPNEQPEEFVSFLEEAMAILEVSPELRKTLEEWCDEHDA